jgi:hypothetical protein
MRITNYGNCWCVTMYKRGEWTFSYASTKLWNMVKAIVKYYLR